MKLKEGGGGFEATLQTLHGASAAAAEMSEEEGQEPSTTDREEHKDAVVASKRKKVDELISRVHKLRDDVLNLLNE